MKKTDVTDFYYVPPPVDLTNTFDVVEIKNKNGTFSTAYNYNVSCQVVGTEDVPKKFTSEYIVKRGDTLKWISYSLYETIEFWWILAKVNGIEDVLEPLEVGRKLKYYDSGTMGNIYTEAKKLS